MFNSSFQFLENLSKSLLDCAFETVTIYRDSTLISEEKLIILHYSHEKWNSRTEFLYISISHKNLMHENFHEYLS